MLTHNPALIAILLLAASVWVGSLVCLAVVSAVGRSTLEPLARVTFFRSLGRRYGIVGTVALVIAIGAGITMIWPPSSWDRLEDGAVALTGVLVVAAALGMRQARAMTRLRRLGLEYPDDGGLVDRVRRGAVTAAVLRGLIAAATLAIVVVAACIISYGS